MVGPVPVDAVLARMRSKLMVAQENLDQIQNVYSHDQKLFDAAKQSLEFMSELMGFLLPPEKKAEIIKRGISIVAPVVALEEPAPPSFTEVPIITDGSASGDTHEGDML